MKIVSRIAPLAATVAVAVLALGADWFDTACTCCKPMHDNPALMQGMTWETHKVAGGLLLVAKPADGMQEAFAATCKSMKALAESVGPDDPMCGFCDAWGEVLQAGAKEEVVETAAGHLTLVTSADPAVVAKIHAMSDRTQAEMDKMAAMHPAE